MKIMLGRTGKQFLRYYFLFFICLVLIFIIFYYINFSMISETYIDTSTAMLETGLANFEYDLSQIDSISRNAFESPRIRRYSFTGPDYSLQDYYNILTIVDDFRRYFTAVGMVADCGIIFSNDIVLTTKRFHLLGTEFYGRYFMQMVLLNTVHGLKIY